MELKYFKTHNQDFYVPEDNFMKVVNVSENDICLMAFDDSNLEGLYKPLNVEKKQFEKLEEFAINKNRKKSLGLLKKIHKENKTILNLNTLNVKPITDPFFDGYYDKLHQKYMNTKPILE